MQSLKQRGRDFVEAEFRIEIEGRIKIRGCEARAGECVEPGTQFVDIAGGHGESAGVGVAAVA